MANERNTQTPPSNNEPDWKAILQHYHPIAIEGPGPSNDKRDPQLVSEILFRRLIHHWIKNGCSLVIHRSKSNNPSGAQPKLEEGTNGSTRSNEQGGYSLSVDGKPIMLLTQGDPPAATGVAAISFEMFRWLTSDKILSVLPSSISMAVDETPVSSTKRVLVTLDDPGHIAYADRTGIFMELRLSQLMEYLSESSGDGCHDDDGESNALDEKDSGAELDGKCSGSIPNRVKNALTQRMETLTHDAQEFERKMQQQQQQPQQPPSTASMKTPKAPRQSTYQYALLQEMTKAAFHKLCSSITVIHTLPIGDIPPWSVTGFYVVGMELGLMEERDYLCFEDDG